MWFLKITLSDDFRYIIFTWYFMLILQRKATTYAYRLYQFMAFFSVPEENLFMVFSATHSRYVLLISKNKQTFEFWNRFSNQYYSLFFFVFNIFLWPISNDFYFIYLLSKWHKVVYAHINSNQKKNKCFYLSIN